MCVKNIYLFLFTYNNRIDRVFFMFGYKSENMVCIINSHNNYTLSTPNNLCLILF